MGLYCDPDPSLLGEASSSNAAILRLLVGKARAVVRGTFFGTLSRLMGSPFRLLSFLLPTVASGFLSRSSLSLALGLSVVSPSLSSVLGVFLSFALTLLGVLSSSLSSVLGVSLSLTLAWPGGVSLS